MNFSNYLNLDFLKYIYFSLNGRISRRYWWWSHIFLFCTYIIILSLFSSLGSSIGFIPVLINVIYYGAAFFVSAKRLQDLGINGLIELVPIVLGIYVMSFIHEVIGGSDISTFHSTVLLLTLIVNLILIIMKAFISGREASYFSSTEPNKYGEQNSYINKFNT